MANEEHVAKLREGVDAWNVWRKQNPGIQPDLQGVDLGEVDLGGVHLGMANLGGANLSKTNLSGANLRRTDLRRANFREANLSSVTFIVANLDETTRGGPIMATSELLWIAREGFSDVIFSGADLSGADLDGADFTSALLGETIFANVDLTGAKGLESCRHFGPSSIDHFTLMRSRNLPLSFLRGCGLPDTFIDYLPSLLNQPIQFYSCFISYSSKDEAFAQRLHADLQDKGVRCWFAPEDMKIGDKIRTRIDEVIRIHDKLLLVLSQNSVASTWVEKEVETAFDKEIKRKEPVLFPIRLDDAVMESKTGWAADIRRSRHIGNFSNWKNHDEYQKGLERLLRDLQIEKD